MLTREVQVASAEDVAEQIQEPFFWIVSLCNQIGIVAERELVTKKEERVDSLIEEWEAHMPSGWFIDVAVVTFHERRTYTKS